MNRFVAAMLVALSLAGCAQLETSRRSAQEPSARETRVVPFVRNGAPLATQGAEQEASTPLVFPGTDTVVNLPPPRPAIQLTGDAVTLNFEEAPLTEVVHAILGDILELDYIIEHPIEGQITLRTRSPVPRDQLLAILESLLQSNGALMVRDAGDRYFVSASPNLGTLLPGVQNPASQGAGYTNIVVPLNYIGAAEMAEILRPVATEDAFVRVDTNRNLLILAGTRNQLNGWLDMIATFDIDQLAGMSVGIFPLDNSTTRDMAAALQQLINAGGSAPAEGEEASAGATALAGLVRIVPLERLNSIMVVSPRAHYIEQVRTWIERLDQAEAASGEATLHVYEVQNGDAKRMAAMIAGIFGSGSSTASSQDTGVAPGLTPMGSGAAGGDGGMPATGSGQQGGASTMNLGNNVRIVADEYNNSLLIHAPRREYSKIRSALEKLDVVPSQVLIEASIIEVTLVDDLEFGVEWFLENSIGDSTGGARLNLGEAANIGPRVPGFSYSITNSADVMRGVINALARDSLVKVISTPSVLVLDNHTAAIHVGDQQPVQTATVVTDGGNTTQSIEYKDTGVKLQVTPSVNSGGLVTMDILQSVTDVGPVDTATGQRSFLQRDVSSRVAIRSGESVVLGGLIRDNASEGMAGIPYLKDIPGIGPLFGRTTRSGTRTELLVFISPRVLVDEQDLRDISNEMRSRMRGLPYFEDLPAGVADPSGR